MRILFICKKNEIYGFETYSRRSSGLFNSTKFIVQGLRARGVHADIVEVQDNNDIDREVTAFRPDVVVIEAFWVVPEKFDILMKLHQGVTWYIHLHSHMPFLALEGIATEWFQGCLARGVHFIANSFESYKALEVLVSRAERHRLIFLPNVYIGKHRHTPFKDGTLWIGCFGAVRPLKNHLLQALAAIRFAREKGKKLQFHINSSRVETHGAPVLKNLVNLFKDLPDAELVNSRWHDPKDFLDFLQNFDLGMQVSLTETFNVVSADYVTAGIPMVVSKEVKWASRFNKAEDDSIDSIVSRMHRVWHNRWLISWNQKLLQDNSEKAQEMWFDFARTHVSMTWAKPGRQLSVLE